MGFSERLYGQFRDGDQLTEQDHYLESGGWGLKGVVDLAKEGLEPDLDVQL